MDCKVKVTQHAVIKHREDLARYVGLEVLDVLVRHAHLILVIPVMAIVTSGCPSPCQPIFKIVEVAVGWPLRLTVAVCLGMPIIGWGLGEAGQFVGLWPAWPCGDIRP